jgi:hypothetical protein
MTEAELAQLAELDRQIQSLQGQRPAGNKALLTAAIVSMGAGLVLPVGGAVVGLVVTVFGSLYGIFAAFRDGGAFFRWLPTFWVGMFSLVPVWGWIAMAVVVAAGAGMLIAAELSDAPRRAQLANARADRRALFEAALGRPDQTSMRQVPSFTVASF